MENPDWVKPGTEVVALLDSGGYGPIRQIAKVHKTGRFTLNVPNSWQYRVVGKNIAVSVGSSWNHATIAVVTDELRPGIEAFRRFERAKLLITNERRRLEAFQNVRFDSKLGLTEQVLKEAEKLNREITVYDWELRTEDGDYVGYARTPEKAEKAMNNTRMRVKPVYTIVQRKELNPE